MRPRGRSARRDAGECLEHINNHKIASIRKVQCNVACSGLMTTVWNYGLYVDSSQVRTVESEKEGAVVVAPSSVAGTCTSPTPLNPASLFRSSLTYVYYPQGSRLTKLSLATQCNALTHVDALTRHHQAGSAPTLPPLLYSPKQSAIDKTPHQPAQRALAP